MENTSYATHTFEIENSLKHKQTSMQTNLTKDFDGMSYCGRMVVFFLFFFLFFFFAAFIAYANTLSVYYWIFDPSHMNVGIVAKRILNISVILRLPISLVMLNKKRQIDFKANKIPIFGLKRLYQKKKKMGTGTYLLDFK